MLKLAYIVELTWLLIDALSGYFQNNGISFPGNQTVGSLFRLFTWGMFCLIVVQNLNARRLATLALLPLAICWSALHAIYWHLDILQILGDLQFLIKTLMAVLMYLVLEIQMERRALNFIQMRRIVVLNAAVLIVNVLLGLLGIGFGQYGETADGELVGGKGFFYAGNEVSVTTVGIFALLIFLYRNHLRQHSARMLLLLAIFFVVAISSLGKTSLMGFVLITAFAMYNYHTIASNIRLALLAVLLTVATTGYWMPLLDVAIERWQFFYELKVNTWAFLTSGRTERIVDFVAWLDGGESILKLILGRGQMGNEATASFENDVLDLLYTMGLFGLLVYAVWSHWLLSGLIRRFRRGTSDEGTFVVCMMPMFLAISVIAGHVLYSAMLAPFIAMIALVSSPAFAQLARRPTPSHLRRLRTRDTHGHTSGAGADPSTGVRSGVTGGSGRQLGRRPRSASVEGLGHRIAHILRYPRAPRKHEQEQ